MDKYPSRYFIPDEFGVFLPLDGETIVHSSDTRLGVYQDHLECGLRFPLSDFFTGVMRFYGVIPSLLSPNSIRLLAAFEVLCRLNSIVPTPSLLNRFFALTVGNTS